MSSRTEGGGSWGSARKTVLRAELVFRVLQWNSFAAAGLVETAIQRGHRFDLKLTRFADFEQEFVERCGVVVAAWGVRGQARHVVIVLGMAVGSGYLR